MGWFAFGSECIIPVCINWKIGTDFVLTEVENIKPRSSDLLGRKMYRVMRFLFT